ncbi:MAG: alpha-amylase family glycosyl hydrolase, partial [Candidatus Woesearchaeota archaeon]
VPFHYAIQKNWGDPDDFARMIDEFHKHDIAVISDFVIGHLPYKDFNIFGLNSDENGIHPWIKENNERLYMKDKTSWGTMRVNFDDPEVRNFFIESALEMMKRYRIDGFRIDNVDGIIRKGPNGRGEERENGRTFLRELNKEVYNYNTYSMIHFEAHYFKDDNAKLLVAPFKENEKALGATAYNSSRMTHYFHTEFMLEDAKKISAWRFKHILEEKEWGKSNSVIADFHNHDAAAGLMENRCTGSYAYDAMTHNRPHNHIHAIGKIKVMEAIISFMNEGRTLDLIQTHLLQKGTFEHDSSIQWHLRFHQANNNCLEFKKEVNKIMDNPAFWPINVDKRKVLNVDDENKILVIKRSSEHDSFVIIMNLSSWIHYNYKVGLDSKNDYKLILNSDLFEYSGFGMIGLPNEFKNKESNNFELLKREIIIPKIAPYHIIVLKELN